MHKQVDFAVVVFAAAQATPHRHTHAQLTAAYFFFCEFYTTLHLFHISFNKTLECCCCFTAAAGVKAARRRLPKPAPPFACELSLRLSFATTSPRRTSVGCFKLAAGVDVAVVVFAACFQFTVDLAIKQTGRVLNSPRRIRPAYAA